MSSSWSWFIVVGTVLSLAACFWLIAWTNRQRASDEELKESEGHVWDEDIRELNNPLPMWWLWLFVLTVLWSVFYLIYFPGMGDYEGLGGWSQEQQYANEMAAAEAKYGPIFAQYGERDIAELAKDPGALSIGASLFSNYCAQCHGSSAMGARGFPDLTDNEWLYGGSAAQIEQSIANGRSGIMPALGAVFASEGEIEAIVSYVQAMQDGLDTSSPAHSKYMSLCVACHGPDGSGNVLLGAPSLIDDTWLYGGSAQEIRKSIVEGRNGVMPANGPLLGPDRTRILAAYVYSLSMR